MELEFEFPETKDKRDEGYTCGCCGQFVKRYSRKLNMSMAWVLIYLYRSGIRDFVHVEKMLKDNNCPQSFRADFHKLVFWRFLEKKKEDRIDGSNRNGFYKITSFGLMFCEGKVKAREKVLIFNNKMEGFDGREITIQDALTQKFNYSELMGLFP